MTPVHFRWPAPLTLVSLLLPVFVLLTLTPGGGLRPAYACSGGVSPLEYYMGLAEYVAVVEVVEVGGPVNSAPTPTPPASPYPTPTISPTPIDFDLTGIGATLQVVDDLLDNAPAQFEVDTRARAHTEAQIRRQEANPGAIAPCPIGFLVPKYEFGQRWLVIAGAWEGQDALATLVRWRVDGSNLVVGTRDGNGRDWSLIVHSPTYNASFAGLPFWDQGPDIYGNLLYQIEVPAVPLASFESAVRYLLMEAAPTPAAVPSTPPPTLMPSGSMRISPPDTGSGGLK